MSEYRSSWWSIDLLLGWSAEESPECVSFFHDDGVGTLQISSYKYDGGTIQAADLKDFTANEFPDDANLEPVACGVLSGLGVDYITNGSFWSKRWVHLGPLLVYTTYTCGAADRAREMSDVHAMLATMKPTDAV